MLEKALKKSEKEIAEARAQVTSVKVDKEREIDLLRAKIREVRSVSSISCFDFVEWYSNFRFFV